MKSRNGRFFGFRCRRSSLSAGTARSGIRTRSLSLGVAFVVAAATAAASLLLPVCSQAQMLSAADQQCITASHKAAAKIVATQNKGALSCLKNASKGKLAQGQTANDCLFSDPKGKLNKAIVSLDTIQNGPAGQPSKAVCPVTRPVVAFAESSEMAAGLQEVGFDWSWSSSGASGRDLASIVTQDKATAKCQQAIVKTGNKLIGQAFKQYTSCLAGEIKSWNGMSDPVDTCFSSTILSDTGGGIAKSAAGLLKTLDKKCTGKSVQPVVATPSHCALRNAANSDLSACVVANAKRALRRIVNSSGAAGVVIPVPFEKITASSTAYLGRLIGYGQDQPLASAPAAAQAPGAAGERMWGTDIGLPVTMTVNAEQRTYFLFGDTDYSDPAQYALGQIVRQEADPADPFVLDNGVNQGDVVAYTTDTNPDDGISLTRVLRNVENSGAPVCNQLDDDDDLRSLFVPGVHDNTANYFSEDVSEITGSSCLGAALNATPTGAFAVYGTMYSITAVQNSFVVETLPDKGFLASSDDGALTWTLLNNGAPISGTTGGPGAKFIHIDALEVDARQYQDPIRTYPCPLPEPPSGDSRALLLFGIGTWLNTGGYLGMTFVEDLEASRDDPLLPLRMYYYAGPPNCWVEGDEDAAVPILDAQAGLHYAYFESPCNYRVFEQSGGLDYVSVARMAGTVSGTKVDRLLLSTNPGYATCKNVGTCCGGTVNAENPNLCDFPADPALLSDSGLGPVVVTSDPFRPWEVARRTDDSLEFTLIEQDPGTMVGPGPHCSTNVPYTYQLGGYAPVMIDNLTRVNSAGDGFDVYMNGSVGRDEGYNVDTARFTVREVTN